MKHIISCEFNLDTASVEVMYADETILSIYIPGVEDTTNLLLTEQIEVDWLIYNDPVTYVNLVLSDNLETYAKGMAGVHGLQD